MSSRNGFPRMAGAVVIACFGMMFLVLVVGPALGIGAAVSESTYAGEVADVEEDSGIVWKTTQVEIKTSAEATEPETFCVHPERTDEILPPLKQAQEDGDRVTVTYERGYAEPMWRCAGTTDGRRIVDVTVYHNGGDAT